MYFAGASAAGMDARQCLAAARSKILAGVSLVFSRVFPQVMASPEANSLWKLANQVEAFADGSSSRNAHHSKAYLQADLVCSLLHAPVKSSSRSWVPH